MPDQAPKKKNAHNLLSNLKSTANQDDKTVKENDTNQKQCSFDCEDAGIPAVDIQEENSEKGIEEIPNRPPKPMYDAMRVEPVLTNLIVERYEGSVDENGFFEGDSTIFFVGGHWYKGPIKDKKMNGQGTYCWSDGTMYKGEFCNNTIAGSGVYSWPDGSVYEGDVKDGLRHGTGTYKCATCPSMYIGEWVNGMRHGKGVLYFDRNCETYYDGDWKYGIKNGYGVHKYKSGNVYQGQWLDNARHGKGKMHWFDRGEEYDGDWVEGVQNGYGKHTWYSKRVTVSQYPIRNEYEGSFMNGERHGYGVFRYASGAKYSGYWDKNVKSGRGEFVFKSGSVFKGMFENDHIVDYPNLVPSRMTTPEIVESGLPVRSQTPLRNLSPAPGPVDALLELNLHELFVEGHFDIERQQTEMEELTRIVLRYMTPIKHIYKFYSKLGVFDSADNAFIMVRMQFWRFLKDCKLHTLGHTLMNIDFIDGISDAKDDYHNQNTQIYIRDFINVLVNISYLLFKDDFAEDDNYNISKCMLKMLTTYVLPNACIVKGSLFQKPELTVEALKYQKKCEDIFMHCRKVINKHDMKKGLRIRDFLWLLKDLKLINSSLTVKKFLDAIYKDDQAMLEERCFNLNNSIVFLEFFETLLDCSQHFRSESSKTEEEREHMKNTTIENAEGKSSNLTKLDDETMNAETGMEQPKSPASASPNKSPILPETRSSNDHVSNEVAQSPSKTSEVNSFRKTSAAGGSRKDQHSTREGGSVSGGSKSKRRGTLENAEADSKPAHTLNGKVKGAKEKEKSSKSVGKSAKKVVIENGKERNTNASVSFDMDHEPERQSFSQLEITTVSEDHSSIKQSNAKIADLALDQGSSIAAEDLMQIHEDSKEPSLNNMNPNSALNMGNVVIEESADDSNEKLQNWISNLQVFLEDHFFPAFELQKKIDEVLNKTKINTNST